MKRILILFIAIMCLFSMVLTVYAQRDLSNEEILANELKELGLFYGVSETDFDLDRAPTRVEAVVMLIRVLGKEAEAKEGTWKHPFTDVPEWANNYIGYAYSKGLANGQALTEFGVGQANAAMYLTFVLRALGYSDTNGADFVWDKPFDLAEQVGILHDTVNLDEFWRSDVVLVSHAALSAHLKGTTQSLYQKLITAGVFTKDKYDIIYNSNGNIPEQKKELTSEEIYAKCSPAVFYIEVYNSKGVSKSSGSGFFINSRGIAVTNYHVIEGGFFATITVKGTDEVYKVLEVIDYNKEEDWAILQIEGDNFPCFNISNSVCVSGGETVYAIGNPLGLESTISQGIVSNPKREIDDLLYIQTNAAISNGSSGGALINKYGEVVGITTSSYVNGQNLNLAIPISYVIGYSTKFPQTLVTFVTGIPNTEITAYSKYPDILNCGAFYGVNPFATTDIAFYYDLSYITSKSWKNGTGCLDYRTALEDWGAIFVEDCYDYDTSTVSWRYFLPSISTDYTFLVGYTTYQGIKSMFVKIESLSNKTIKTFSEDSHIPDFGAYFNIDTLGTPRTFKLGENLEITHYAYSVSELLLTKYKTRSLSLYMRLLISSGFVLESDDVNNAGIRIYSFVHPKYNEMVSCNISQEGTFVYVNVYKEK